MNTTPNHRRQQARYTWLMIALPQAEGEDAKRPTSAADVRFFELEHTNVTDAGLQELAGLKSLKGVSLSGTKVTDKGIAELKNIEPAKNFFFDIESFRALVVDECCDTSLLR